VPVREVPRDVHGERARSDDQEDRGTDDRAGALHDRSIPNAAANRLDSASAGVAWSTQAITRKTAVGLGRELTVAAPSRTTTRGCRGALERAAGLPMAEPLRHASAALGSSRPAAIRSFCGRKRQVCTSSRLEGQQGVMAALAVRMKPESRGEATPCCC